MLVGWSDRRRRNWEFRWNNDVEDFGDFVCDHVGRQIFIMVEDNGRGEGGIFKLPVTDPNGYC